MSGYFAGLMRQTGIAAASPSVGGAAAPASSASATSASAAAPAPLEREVAVDAAPPPAPSAEPRPPAPREGAAPPPPVSHPLETPGLIPRNEAFSAPPAAPVAPLEVDAARAAAPPPPLVIPPSGAIERILPPAADASGIPQAPSDPPSSHRTPPLERTVLRETEPVPSAAPLYPVRGIPADPPRVDLAGIDRMSTRAVPPRPPEEAFEVPAAPPPPAVHPFAEVLAEVRRWVAATPVPGEAVRADEAGLELDAFASAAPSPFAPAGSRPRRQTLGIAEANEEVHVSIGAITVTIEDPTAAARPAAPAPAPRPEPDFRSRMARHYLRPE